MTATFKRVHPVIPVRDVRAALEFYEKLGFALVFLDNEAQPRYAGVERDGVQLHLQWHEPATFETGVDKLALRFVIDDVEALFDEFQAQNVVPTGKAVKNTSWHTREFEFFDPDGNGLFFYRAL